MGSVLDLHALEEGLDAEDGAGEMQARYRGDAGEIWARCRRDIGEIRARYRPARSGRRT